MVIERPEPTEEHPQHWCADQGYDFPICREQAEAQGYVPHIRARGEERQAQREHPDYHPRRWVVEVCHSWLNRFRKLLVRFEKLKETYLALLHFACASLVFRRAVSC